MDFDPQATQFDARAGLGAGAAPAIAAALITIANLKPAHALLEIGAGTGEIGAHLAACCRYVGLDRSREMLYQFQARSADSLLLIADAAQPWPVVDRSVRVVFLSRVAHLLDRDTLLTQLERVAHPDGCCVLFGRRKRDPESEQRTLQRELHARLRARGLQPRQGERDTRGHLDTLLARGAERIDEQVACEWTVGRSPADSLRAWASKPGLSGLDLPAAERAELLADLTMWARSRWPDLEVKASTRERYVLSGARLSVGSIANAPPGE